MAKYITQNSAASREYGKHNKNNMEYRGNMLAEGDRKV